MHRLPYIMLGALLVGAILAVMLPNNSTEPQQVALAPTSQPSTSGEILGEEAPETSTATITTTKGVIVVTLFADAAPNTVRNFIEKANREVYNNLTFKNVEDWVITINSDLGADLAEPEINNNPFMRGSIGVSHGGVIEVLNNSQFFITKDDASGLNGLYTNFGQVSGGMDVVDNLEPGDKIISISVE